MSDLSRFALDMAMITCPECGDQSYPDDLGQAVSYAQAHECDQEALRERQFRDRMQALREGRRAAGLRSGDPRVVHHLDGNARNNDPENLRVMDPKENDRP